MSLSEIFQCIIKYGCNIFLHFRRDILVVTAQVLLNSLTLKEIPSLMTFSMIVFDECHHTNNNHRFNEIMSRYMDLKLVENADIDLLPQVMNIVSLSCPFCYNLPIQNAKIFGAVCFCAEIISYFNLNDWVVHVPSLCWLKSGTCDWLFVGTLLKLTNIELIFLNFREFQKYVANLIPVLMNFIMSRLIVNFQAFDAHHWVCS